MVPVLLLAATLGTAGCAPSWRAGAAAPPPTPTAEPVVVDGARERVSGVPVPAEPAPGTGWAADLAADLAGDPAEDPAADPAVPPTPPAETAHGDRAGALAAGRHVLALYDHAITHLDEAPLAAMCSGESRWCAAVIGRVSAARAAGDDAPDETLTTVVTSADTAQQPDGTWTVELAVERAHSIAWVDPATGVPVLHLDDPYVEVQRLRLGWDGTRWSVLGVASG